MGRRKSKKEERKRSKLSNWSTDNNAPADSLGSNIDCPEFPIYKTVEFEEESEIQKDPTGTLAACERLSFLAGIMFRRAQEVKEEGNYESERAQKLLTEALIAKQKLDSYLKNHQSLEGVIAMRKEIDSTLELLEDLKNDLEKKKAIADADEGVMRRYTAKRKKVRNETRDFGTQVEHLDLIMSDYL